jgi:hypothetical protein
MLPGGEKLIRGRLTIGSLAAGGAALNLANYFKSSSVPTVIVGGLVNATNWAAASLVNVVNAETIKIMAMCGGKGASEPFYLMNAGLELTAQNTGFYAIGQAY